MDKIELKPLDWFKVDPNNRKDFNQEELLQLGQSLKVKQLQPVVALADGTLVAGHRRLGGAKLVGLQHLNTLILEGSYSPAQIKVFKLTENLQRVDLDEIQQWKELRELQQLCPEKNYTELAALLKKNNTWITRVTSVSDCIDAVQDAFKAGKLSFADCYTISKASSQEQEMLLAMRLNGTTQRAIQAVQRKKKKSASAPGRVRSLKIPLPSGASVTISGEGLSDVGNVITMLAEVMKAARKAVDDGIDGSTWARVMASKTKPVSD